MTLPVDFLTASLTNATQLLADFATPLEFIVGAIILFIVVPKVVRWFKVIGK